MKKKKKSSLAGRPQYYFSNRADFNNHLVVKAEENTSKLRPGERHRPRKKESYSVRMNTQTVGQFNRLSWRRLCSTSTEKLLYPLKFHTASWSSSLLLQKARRKETKISLASVGNYSFCLSKGRVRS